MAKIRKLTSIGVVGLVALAASHAKAVKPFSEEFGTMYVKPDSNNPNEKALAIAVGQGTQACNVCHIQGKHKRERNAYGQELAKLLKRKTDTKDIPKIQGALKKVAEMPHDPTNPQSPKFGDLIKQGKLPGG